MNHSRKKHPNPWACWKPGPMPHPFDPDIADVACGFDARLTEPRCSGCWRAREESAMDQLAARNGLGDAAHIVMPRVV